MAGKAWNSRKQARLVQMYEANEYSTKQMALDLGVTQRTIYNRFLTLGWQTQQLPRRYRGPKKVEFTEEQKRLVARRKQLGEFTTTIARDLDISRSAVLRLVRELGYTNSNLLPLPVGQRFSSLVVVGQATPQLNRRTGNRVSSSLVRCDCGSEVIVPNHAIRCGNTKSCGGPAHRLKANTPWVRIKHQVTNGARARNVPMNLSFDQIKALAQMSCAYCSQLGYNRQSFSNGNERVRYNGIDQIVPCGGYEMGNVIPCCRICNRAKSNLSLSDFIAWLRLHGSQITDQHILEQALKLKQLLT